MSPDPNRGPTDTPDESEVAPHDERRLRRERQRRRLRHGRRRLFAVLPTLLTLANAACGFGAITFAAKVGPFTPESSAAVVQVRHAEPGIPTGAVATPSPENPVTDSSRAQPRIAKPGTHLFIAAVLIYLAMVFDALDGRAARWANQSSQFGAELDSLCDAISFGLAPAFLMLQFIQYRFGPEFHPPFVYPPRLLWVIALLFTLCAILRLARFNVETEDDDSHNYFSGLPSPAAAGTVASFPLAIGGLMELAAEPTAWARPIAPYLVPAVQVLLPLITLATAILMVSRVRYVHIFNQLFSGRRSRRHLIQIVFGLAAVFLMKEMAVPVLFCYFAFTSPVQAGWRRLNGRRNTPTNAPSTISERQNSPT